MHVKKRYFISRSPDARNVGNPYDMKNRNIAAIAKNNHSTMYRGEACGFIKVQSHGLYTNSNTIIDGFMGSFMHRNYTGYMEGRLGSGELI